MIIAIKIIGTICVLMNFCTIDMWAGFPDDCEGVSNRKFAFICGAIAILAIWIK